MDPIAAANETMRQARVRAAWLIASTGALAAVAMGILFQDWDFAYAMAATVATAAWSLRALWVILEHEPEVRKARLILRAAEDAEVARAVEEKSREVDALGRIVARLREAGDPRVASVAAQVEARARALKAHAASLEAAAGAERAQPDPSPERIAAIDGALARRHAEIARIEGSLRDLNALVALREPGPDAHVDGLDALLDEVAASVEVEEAGRAAARPRVNPEGQARSPADRSTAQALDELWAASPGHSGGERIRREDAYEGRSR